LILAPSMSRRSPFASGFFLRQKRRQGFICGARINRKQANPKSLQPPSRIIPSRNCAEQDPGNRSTVGPVRFFTAAFHRDARPPPFFPRCAVSDLQPSPCRAPCKGPAANAPATSDAGCPPASRTNARQDNLVPKGCRGSSEPVRSRGGPRPGRPQLERVSGFGSLRFLGCLGEKEGGRRRRRRQSPRTRRQHALAGRSGLSRLACARQRPRPRLVGSWMLPRPTDQRRRKIRLGPQEKPRPWARNSQLPSTGRRSVD